MRAQNAEYGVMIDTTYMMIGDQQNLTFQLKGDAGMRVKFPFLRDTVSRGIEDYFRPVARFGQRERRPMAFPGNLCVTAFDTGYM